MAHIAVDSSIAHRFVIDWRAGRTTSGLLNGYVVWIIDIHGCSMLHAGQHRVTLCTRDSRCRVRATVGRRRRLRRLVGGGDVLLRTAEDEEKRCYQNQR
jgi:hypothetical protein